MKIVDGWLDVAQEIDYSANSMSRQGYGVKYLVIHGTAGGTSAQSIGQFFQNTVGSSNPVSSHFIIDQQGNIVQGIPLSLASFANGVITNGHATYLPDPSINPNWYTASIEFVKASDDNSNALTAIQQQVGFEVIQCICDTYNIPKRAGDVNGGIIQHADIDPINRARCPGTLNFNALWTYLANGGDTPMAIDLSTPGVSNYFEGSSDIWRCKKTGFAIGHGILGFYQKFGGDALCGLTYLGLPTSPETGTGTTGTVYQRFERGVLAYDPQHLIDSPPQAKDVYLLHIDKGIGQDPQVAQLALENAQLKAQNVAIQQLPAVANVLAVNKLAAQIVLKTQVQ